MESKSFTHDPSIPKPRDRKAILRMINGRLLNLIQFSFDEPSFEERRGNRYSEVEIHIGIVV